MIKVSLFRGTYEKTAFQFGRRQRLPWVHGKDNSGFGYDVEDIKNRSTTLFVAILPTEINR